jgi:hypothetical protein
MKCTICSICKTEVCIKNGTFYDWQVPKESNISGTFEKHKCKANQNDRKIYGIA